MNSVAKSLADELIANSVYQSNPDIVVKKHDLHMSKSIQMQLIDGPFRSLTGGWTFSALSEEACKIELNLEFEFSNKLAEMAFGKVFNSLATSMVTAFTERARSVYA